MAIINGTSGNDVLNGTVDDDEIYGLGGNDSLFGDTGNDLLQGGTGSDTLQGDAGIDTYLWQSADLGSGILDTVNEEITGPGVNHIKLEGINSSEVYGYMNTDYLYYVIETAPASGAYNTIRIHHGITGNSSDISSYISSVIFDTETWDLTTGLRLIDQPGNLYHSFYGAAGDDYFDGGAGNDTLFGQGGNDTLIGGAGNDILSAGTGADLLQGGSGADSLTGGDGDDTYLFKSTDLSTGQDTIDEEVLGSGGTDTLRLENIMEADVYGYMDINYAYYVIDGGTFFNTIRIHHDVTADSSDLATKIEQIEYDSAIKDLSMGLRMVDQTGNLYHSFYGASGDDYFDGQAGNDSLYGQAGADTLLGGAGNDSIFGGADDDLIKGGQGHDTLQGGVGVDTYLWQDIDLASGLQDTVDEEITGPGANTIKFETILSSQVFGYMDGNYLYYIVETSVGSGAFNTIRIAHDVTANSSNVDNYITDIVFDSETWILANGIRLIDQVGNLYHSFYGAAGDDYFDGQAGNDNLFGQGGNDTLIGGAGNDILYGGAGNDLLHGQFGSDTLNGGLGDDTYLYKDTELSNTTDTIDEETAGGGLNILQLEGIAEADVYGYSDANYTYYQANSAGNVETIRVHHSVDGTTGSDVASYINEVKLDSTSWMQAGGLRLIDFQGNLWHTLYGNSGDDYLDGGQGNDTLNGYLGNDTLLGGSGNDTLNGAEGADILQGQSGADTLNGGLGDDTYLFVDAELDNSTDNIDEETSGGGINNLRLQDVLKSNTFGYSDTNYTYFVINNGSAANTIRIAHDIDANGSTIATQIATVDFNSDSWVLANGLTLTDVVGNLWHTLHGNAGNDILDGQEGNDTLYGYAGADRLVGGSGNDTLFGGLGDDRLTGGTGADSLNGDFGFDAVFYTGSSAAVQVDLLANTGTGGEAQGDTFSSIERVVGSAFGDVLTGDNNSNRLEGRDGDDQLFGNGGFDKLLGGAGADLMDGGADFDTVTYETSTAAVQINLTTGIHTGGYAAGDVIMNVERILGSDFNDSLTGSGVTDRLEGGDGDDMLFGLGGNDILFGNAGADAIDGGSGRDIIYYNRASSGVVVDLVNGGSLGEALGDTFNSVEIVKGSNFNDTLLGDTAFNNLFGNDGDDILGGREGDDTIQGNAGNDTFVIETGWDKERIKDWVNGDDQFDVSDFGITQADAVSMAFVFGSGWAINFGGGDVLIVENANIADVDVTDFIV
ncbi:MAG: calcium-binding protein [bacterium]